MEKKGKSALVLGATGLVGSILTKMLLEDSRYSTIKVFVRRDFEFSHPKLEVYKGNLLDMDSFKPYFTGDDVFCCIGTTKSKTPDKEKYRQIDYGIPLQAARLAVENNISAFTVISAMGANPKSSVFYNRVKGEMEDAVLNQGLPNTYVVRPSMIGGQRDEKRPVEHFFKKLMSSLGFLMQGPLKKYRVIEPNTIAKAMIWLANNGHQAHRIDSETLKQLARNGAS